MAKTQSNSTQKNLSYRPDIDGLRALAVSAVVLFHLFPGFLKGGFVGVDVFFVISGFLITRIIIREINYGCFSFWNFYARRIRRIFPALIMVLFATMIMGWCFLFPDENVLLSKDIIAASLFFYNFLLLNSVGYFDAVFQQKPLLHLWSLGIEEQFYIVWPLLVVFIWKFVNRRFSIVAVVLFCSFFLNIVLKDYYPTANYYLPFTRFWELLLGSILAMLIPKGDPVEHLCCKAGLLSKNTNWLRNVISVFGFILVIGSILILSNEQDYPGWNALLPTLGTLMLIMSGSQAWINQYILSLRPVVFVGLISYPLYLWHWPLLIWSEKVIDHFNLNIIILEFFENFNILSLSWSAQILTWLIQRIDKFLGLLITIILAVATYLLLEKWVRKPTHLKKKTWGFFILLVLIFPVAAQFQSTIFNKITASDGRGQFLKKYESPDSLYRQSLVEAYRPECSFYLGRGDVKSDLIPSCYVSKIKPTVMLWGDSHAMHLRPGFDTIQQELAFNGKDFEVLQITSGSCHASLAKNNKMNDEAHGCNLANELAIEVLAKVKPDIVIIAQAIGHDEKNWNLLLTEILRLGAKHVFVLGPVPQWKNSLPRLVAYNYWPEVPERISSDIKQEIFRVDEHLKQKINITSNIQYISAIDFFCDDLKSCMVVIDKDSLTLTSQDSGHLTSEASSAFVRSKFMPYIESLF
jgi:peptidoglycan/LPS O-acetylase OafA/YrhL